MKGLKISLGVIAATCLLFAVGCAGDGRNAEPVSDDGRTTRAEVVDFVEEAVDYARVNGKEKALTEFSDRNGAFVRNGGDLYVYAYDFNGNVIAHGGDQSLIGKNLIDFKDPEGLPVIQKLVKLAQGGSGWLTYTWENPETGKQQKKLGYVMKVDDTWFLGSGMYE
ncbi:MAG: cache domain-containing protein [Actinobacteria bacterium]|nr:cache domain-containing protein [Actinomycetota bacterium]